MAAGSRKWDPRPWQATKAAGSQAGSHGRSETKMDR